MRADLSLLWLLALLWPQRGAGAAGADCAQCPRCPPRGCVARPAAADGDQCLYTLRAADANGECVAGPFIMHTNTNNLLRNKLLLG